MTIKNDLPRLNDGKRASNRPVRPVGGFRDCDTGTPIEGLPKARPCPFCGDADPGDIVENETNDPQTEALEHYYLVQCSGCLAQGPAVNTQLEAAEAWNGAMPRQPRRLPDHVADVPQLNDDDRDAVTIRLGGIPLPFPRDLMELPAVIALRAVLENMRRDVEQARAVTACASGALHHMNVGSSDDVARTLTAYVDNELCEQVEKLDDVIAKLSDDGEGE